jgi:hypothetical protein
MTLEEMIVKVSQETAIPKEVVEKAYMSFWEYIRNSIQTLPLKEDLSEEDFNKLKVNFNIPSIGKLYLTYSRYRALKDRIKYFKAIQNDNDNQEN